MNTGAETPEWSPLAMVKRIKPCHGPKMVYWGWMFTCFFWSQWMIKTLIACGLQISCTQQLSQWDPLLLECSFCCYVTKGWPCFLQCYPRAHWKTRVMQPVEEKCRMEGSKAQVISLKVWSQEVCTKRMDLWLVFSISVIIMSSANMVRRRQKHRTREPPGYFFSLQHCSKQPQLHLFQLMIAKPDY